MPTKQVTIQGVMTWEGDEQPKPPSDAHPEHPIYYPPYIWGPNDPRPTPPIYLPPNLPGGGPSLGGPGWGWVPGGPGAPPTPGQPTPPERPRPGVPTPGWPSIPGAPGQNPPGSPGGPSFPNQPPGIPEHPGLPPGGSVVPPAALVPIDGKLVFVPGYGWMFIPSMATEPGPPGEKPPVENPGDKPHVDHTLPGDLPPDPSKAGAQSGPKMPNLPPQAKK